MFKSTTPVDVLDTILKLLQHALWLAREHLFQVLQVHGLSLHLSRTAMNFKDLFLFGLYILFECLKNSVSCILCG